MTPAELSEEQALLEPLVDGASLAQLSASGPVLLVFIRHFGCTFCQEQLEQLGSGFADLRRAGITLVITHMGTNDYARRFLQRFGLEDAQLIPDPQKVIYRAFGLQRARPVQLFSLRVWLRGLWVALTKRHWNRVGIGDPWQMPGLFIVNKGVVTFSFRPHLPSEQPDLAAALSLGAASAG